MNRVIHDDLVMHSHWFQLFDSAAKSGTDTGSHDE